MRSEAEQLKSIKHHTLEEIEAILAQAKNRSIRDYAMFLVAYNHGMRPGEIGLIQYPTHFDDEKHRIYISRAKGGIPNWYKTKENEHKAIREWLKIRELHPGPLFVSRKSAYNTTKGRGISSSMVYDLFRKYAERANIPASKVHPHTLRHSCGVHMIDAGLPLEVIKDWLGHNSIQSTEIYAKVSDKLRNETAERFFASTEREKREKRIKVNWKKDRRGG